VTLITATLKAVKGKMCGGSPVFPNPVPGGTPTGTPNSFQTPPKQTADSTHQLLLKPE